MALHPQQQPGTQQVWNILRQCQLTFHLHSHTKQNCLGPLPRAHAHPARYVKPG